MYRPTRSGGKRWALSPVLAVAAFLEVAFEKPEKSQSGL
jgi:hypothetical protein